MGCGLGATGVGVVVMGAAEEAPAAGFAVAGVDVGLAVGVVDGAESCP